MADQTRTVKILIDDAQLQRQLENAQKKALTLENKLKNLDTGSKQWAQTNAELQKVNGQISTLHGQISGKLGPSQTQLEQEQRKLNKAIKEMPVELRKASEEYKRLQLVSGQLRQIRNEANENAKQLGNVKDRIGRLADGFNKYMGMIMATMAAFTGVILGLRKAKDLYDEFEASVANLSALTGLQGEELNFLKEKAIELSQSFVEGSVRITKSAKEIAEAFTIVGSQRPELLKNKEELAEVTKQALILAEAAQIDLQTAVKGVTTSLNQFNLEGKEAARVNNVLAAGSKVGAGTVAYQAEALEKSGTAMKFAKIEIEEGIGLIETMAPRFASPEMAGTQLKNVILKLETALDKKLRPSVVGLLPALENLKNKNWDATKMLHFFGVENITAASILVDYRSEVAEYTKAVTNTSIALDQASTNTDTNKAKMAQARNELNNNLMVLGGKFSPMVTSATGLLNKLFVTLIKLPQFWKENRQEILYFGIALVGLRLNSVIAMIQSVSSAVGAATISFRAFTTAIKANPFGLAIAAISTLIGLLGVFGKKTKEAVKENSNLFDSTRRGIEIMDEERTTLNKLFDQLEKTTNGSVQRQKVIDEINSKYGTTLKNLKDEAEFALMVRDAYAEITKQLRNKVKAQVMEEEVTDIERRMKEIKKRFTQMGVELLEETSLNGDVSFGLPTQNENGLNVFYTDEDLEKLNKYNELLAEQEKILSDLTDIEIKKPVEKLDTKNTSGNEPTESEEKKAEKLFEKINKLAEDSRLFLEKKDEQTEDRVRLKYSRLETEALKYFDKSHKIFALLEEAQQNELAKVRNDAWDKEMAELDKEFQEKLKAIDKNYQDVKKLRQGLSDAIAKSAADDLQAETAMLQKVVSDETKTISVRRAALLKLHRAELYAIAEKKRAEREAFEEQLKDVTLTEAQRTELVEKITLLEQDSLNQNLLIHQNYYDAIAQLDQDSFNRKLDSLNNYSSKLMGIYNTLNDVTVNHEQSRIDSLNKEHENELQKLEEQKNSKLISEEEYNAKKKEIDDRYRKEEAKIKSQQFERQKTADLIQAGINTAVSITKAFATFGWPAGILPAGFALAEGLAQQSAISSKEAPQFGTGADLRGKGKKHSQGGIFAELETGEVVLSADTVANNSTLVDTLLDASLNKGGAAINFPSNPILDFTPYFSASKLLFATGGKVGVESSSQTINNHYSQSTPLPTEYLEIMLSLKGAVEGLNTTLNNGINAVYDDDELLFLRRRLSQLERLEGLNNIKKS